jgi:uncharacterized protein (TIGR03435 family)
MRRSMLLSIALMLLAVAGAAQERTANDAAAFDAASMRQNNSGDQNTSFRRQPGGLTATNAPAAMFISMAYQLQPFQMQGAPGWLNSERYDVVARMAANADAGAGAAGSPDAVAMALRAFLADRLKLAVHWETQQRDVYALVQARPDGKLGPAIRPAAIDCNAQRAQGAVPPANTPERVVCGMRNSAGQILFGGYPLSFFTNAIGGEVGRMVVDNTGLSGAWDFELTYRRERRLAADADNPAADRNLPSLFTAVQEQLGLKLESIKAPVQILVIDHVERPATD